MRLAAAFIRTRYTMYEVLFRLYQANIASLACHHHYLLFRDRRESVLLVFRKILANLVTMRPTKIELESGDSLAVIFVTDVNAKLTEIRNQMEVSDLIPRDFNFISSWGPPISRVQEAKISLSEALREEKLIIREDKVGKTEDESETPSQKAVSQKRKFEESEPSTPKVAARGKRKVQSTLTNLFGAKSSPTARLASTAARKGVHLFSQLDIAGSSENEKARKTWWNEKAKEVCEDPAYDMLKGDELDQLLHEKWRVYKATKVLEEQERINEAMEDFLKKNPDMVERMTSQSKAKQDTIERNVQRLHTAQTTVVSSSEKLKQLSLELSETTEIRETKSLRKEMKEQNEAHKSHSKELAKAIDALSHLLAIRKGQLSELVKEKDSE